MIPAVYKDKALAIAYDSERITTADSNYFDPEYWRSQQALAGTAVGRGNTWFVNSIFGPVVLRQYLRGGWVARISKDRYFFTTISRSRPFREFFALVDLHKLGLPVPKPVAALCRHNGMLSSGALITQTIENSQTLADILSAAGSGLTNNDNCWERVGACIRRFHNAGVWHADLNARNILLDSAKGVYLVDFDRARLSPGKKVNGEGNLKRLKRSLIKLWPGSHNAALESAWEQLRAGYDG